MNLKSMDDLSTNLSQMLCGFDDLLAPIEEIEAGPVNPPELAAECAAFMFCPDYRWKDGGWASYYGPMFGGTTDEGKLVHTPDIHRFDSATFAYWAKRAREAKHPVLKVRYADLCWEFEK